MASAYYTRKVDDVLLFLNTDSRGLTHSEAKRRLALNGPNEITAKGGRSIWQLLAEQFMNLLVVLLFLASVLSFFLGSHNDAIVLMAIVVINALVGFFQDWKSENIVARLGSLVAENAIALRDGHRIEVPSTSLVAGDVIYLQEGDAVPADCRLISAESVMTNEFALSGESVPTEKSADFLTAADLPLPDRRNFLYYGTSLARGEALAVVCDTGDGTELGKIAASSQSMNRETSPLQKELNIVGVYITRFAIALAIGLFIVQLLRSEPLKTAIVFAVSVAAAMVPAGLPAQISMALSLGVARLARKKAVVKRLSSVEALGAATVIATDKTGTITKNQMTITSAYFEGVNFRITGTGYNPDGEIFDESGRVMNPDSLGDFKILFLAGFLSSTGAVNAPDEFHDDFYALGDPTEAAFATLLMKAGFDQQATSLEYERKRLFPFDSARKRISIVREHKNRQTVFVKGSIESVLACCTHERMNDKQHELTDQKRSELLAISRAYANQALRVIALAFRDLEEGEDCTQQSAEANLIFSGFVTMIDPPREEVRSAVLIAHRAGIRTIMITGDHQATARTIATEAGMADGLHAGVTVINRDMLTQMQPAELERALAQRSVVFSRVSPDEKLQIVEALQRRGDVVAVTGDGVNDTLSLKRADIGVAMGAGGSKVAQEAASLVLLNNSFATIVEAIKEGRMIFRNLQTNVVAALSTNVTQLFCVLIGFALIPAGLPPITLPVQILLVDFVGEMLPLLAITFDPPDPGLMERAPRKKGELLARGRVYTVFAYGLVRGALAAAAFIAVYRFHAGQPGAWETGMSATFATVILTQFVSIFHLRSTRGAFSRYSLTNPLLFLGIGLSTLAMLAIIYLPVLNAYLHMRPLFDRDLAVIGTALLTFVAFTSLWRRLTMPD